MAAARAVSLAIIEGPVLPDVEGGVAVEVEPAINDGVVGIDHAQRLPAAHGTGLDPELVEVAPTPDRKSTRLNSSHSQISYAVFCLKKKTIAHHADSPVLAQTVS